MRQTTGPSHRNARVASGLLAIAVLILVGANEPPAPRRVLTSMINRLEPRLRPAVRWYRQTPPLERVGWGGLAACAFLGAGVWLSCVGRLRRKRIIPAIFLERFLPRLKEGKLDRPRGLELCDLNPSSAARVVRVAVERWGRPIADLERGVALAMRIESTRLRRQVATLRRIAAVAPLLGLLGSLAALGNMLSRSAHVQTALAGPALAEALGPITAGVALAAIALAAYDGLAIRVDNLINRLDRLGGETIDLIAMSLDSGIAGREHGHLVAGPHRAFVRTPMEKT